MDDHRKTHQISGIDFPVDRLLDLLDRAYVVAEDESRDTVAFEEFVAAAEAFYFEQFGDVDVGAHVPDTDLQAGPLARHLARLDRKLNSEPARPSEHLAHLFVRARDGQAVGNTAAQQVLGAMWPTPLEALVLEDASRTYIRKLLHRMRSDPDWTGETVTLRLGADAQSYVARCVPLARSEGAPEDLTLSITLGHVDWRRIVDAFVSTSFGLTTAECDLLEHLLRGATQREAATAMDKSPETVKAQAKGILRKTQHNRMSELIHLITSYAYLTDQASLESETIRNSEGTLSMKLPSGRTLGYYRCGRKGGYPILFVHGLIQGPFFSARMGRILDRLGLEVIAPSRPSFGATDPPNPRSAFNRLVVEDAVALVDALGLRPGLVMAHQGGVSHACRIATALAGWTEQMIMIGAGIPIDEDKHLKAMNRQTRVAAVAARHTPQLLETFLRIGLRVWGRNARGYLKSYFGKNSEDTRMLDHPEIGPLQIAGAHHMIDAGAEGFLDDGRAAMANWLDDYLSVPCPRWWFHAQNDPIMGAEFVVDFLKTQPGEMVRLFPDGGNCMLYIYFDEIMTRVAEIAGKSGPHQAEPKE